MLVYVWLETALIQPWEYFSSIKLHTQTINADNGTRISVTCSKSTFKILIC